MVEEEEAMKVKGIKGVKEESNRKYEGENRKCGLGLREMLSSGLHSTYYSSKCFVAIVQCVSHS